MSTSNESLPKPSKPITPPDSSQQEPTGKPSAKPVPPWLDLFIKTAIARFNDQETPYPKGW
jgi:hypothetical protein